MKRRGTSIVEMIVASVLLAAVMAASVQMLVVSSAGRRALQRRQVALQEASNLMEHLAARPWDDLTPQGVAAVQPSQWARQALSQPSVKIEIATSPDDPAAKRIAVTLDWRQAAGRQRPRVQLVSWRYRR